MIPINFSESDDQISDIDRLVSIPPSTEFPFMDRELSWLNFNNRVLDLVDSGNIPILERVKFLSIANSNLDEFFSIRVSSRLNENKDSNQNVSKILKECRDMLLRIDSSYSELRLNLRNYDIDISDSDIQHIQKNSYSDDDVDENSSRTILNNLGCTKEMFNYFKNNIQPSLTPLILDKTRPIPHLKPFSIYITLIVKNGSERIGLIEVTPQLERLIKFGNKESSKWYFIEDIIISNLDQLYPGMTYSDITAFRILREGNPEELDDNKYVESMVKHVRSRMLFNEPVRVDIWGFPRKKIINMIKESLDITKKFIFNTSMRLKLSDIMILYNKINKVDLKYPEFKPTKLHIPDKTLMSTIAKRDILVHHPYESFNDSVLRLIQEACVDPHVISIKQILYRSGTDSNILKYLLKAAEAGKNVVVVIELKARFDEEVNIEWAEKLKRAGAIVVYGYEHIKTHAKLIHIFKLKDGKSEQFVHIGTGNYSEKNSRTYTDFGYFTSNKKICSDINNIFNMLTGGFISNSINLDKVKISPIYNRKHIYDLIDEEISKRNNGYICIKVNNISDIELTKKLYDASNAGVKIDIICRGSCSVIPKVIGYSENINVTSIIGRFLEHSRVLIFGTQDQMRAFITSSDLMTRNLDRRLEVLFEIESSKLKSDLYKSILMMLGDTYNNYTMQYDCIYNKDLGDYNSQQSLIDYYNELATKI